MFHTTICDLLGVRYPILQGAMQGAGGPELVAAVSQAGGLGILPTFGGTEERLAKDIADTRRRTAKPIAVNITPMGKAFTESRARICIDMAIPIVTTGRADPGQDAVEMLKKAGILVLSVIPSVEHARRMEAEGVDAIIASGNEAGGHVGGVATLPLVPQVVDAVNLPVLAAGGIADGRGFLAALSLGAVGIQIGTRLIATPESDASDWYKAQVLGLQETGTLVTKALTGATVRCFATPEIRAYEEALRNGASQEELKALRQAVRRDYGHSEEVDRGSIRQGAVGQVAGMVHGIKPVAEIISQIIDDAARISHELASLATTEHLTAG